jgi:hypothetical protein
MRAARPTRLGSGAFRKRKGHPGAWPDGLSDELPCSAAPFTLCCGSLASDSLLPPSPPGEKTTARQDQTRQASPRDRTWHMCRATVRYKASPPPFRSPWIDYRGSADAAQPTCRVKACQGDRAGTFAAGVLPIIRQIQKSGVSSLRGVAKALSARGVKTARGGEWTAVQVSDILRRA